jgi:hypothetical protein
MRMCLKVQVPADGGSPEAAKELPGKIEQIMEMLKPEAVYFFPQDGMRTMMIYFDMQEVSMMPMIAQPMVDELNAKITFSPAMNLDDFLAGLRQMQESR